MGKADSSQQRKVRRDGWTVARQLCFLDALADTGSVRKAAACANMSRESAYRLRNRSEGRLFAALWDRALVPDRGPGKGHTPPLTDGRILRLLGNHYRREFGDFRSVGERRLGGEAPDRT